MPSLRGYTPPQVGLVANGCYVNAACNAVQIERKERGLEWLSLDQAAINTQALATYGQPLAEDKIWKTMRTRGELAANATYTQLLDTRTRLVLGERPYDSRIRSLLAAGHPVTWDLLITSAWLDPTLVRIPPPNRGEVRPYAHSVAIVDWVDPYIIAAGTTQFNAQGWKDFGFAWIHQDWLAERLDGTLGTFMYLSSLGTITPPTGNAVLIPQIQVAANSLVVGSVSQAQVDNIRNLCGQLTADTPSAPPGGLGSIPPSGSLTDHNGDVWTLTGTQAKKNGTYVGGAVEKLVKDSSGAIWGQYGTNWYKWHETLLAWSFQSGPPS